jgi:pSer/pThr/pTyr-binding forkhead associated (FHA) protein
MSGSPKNQPEPGPREATRLESDDEIRQALLTRRAAARKPAAVKDVVPLAAPVDADPDAFRPRQRPPMALLCILDDGKEDGEWVRLRHDRYVLGRTDGDIRIPHDVMMSGRHAEISRQQVQGVYRWFLSDHQSTNGTYVRVGSALLKHRQEILIGHGHYRFEAAQVVSEEEGSAPPPDAPPQTTVSWHEQSVRNLVPSLVELARTGVGQRFPLPLAEYWIGRDPKSCAIVRADDPLVNARHARLYRDAKNQWHIENNKSRNGLWVRIEQMPLSAACQFQLGEQRFILRVLS